MIMIIDYFDYDYDLHSELLTQKKSKQWLATERHWKQLVINIRNKTKGQYLLEKGNVSH